MQEILESQFDKNPAFRTIVTALNASDLRSQPLGKDKLGNAYWSTIDGQCNMRIYQEHLDEEIWKIVAMNREELVKLISCLKGNELVMPSLVGVVDEDSSSNSMPPKVDALQNGNGAQNGHSQSSEAAPPATKENVPNLKIKLNNGGESTVEQVGSPAQKETDKENDDEADDDSNVSEIDESSQAASESSATTVGTKSNVRNFESPSRNLSSLSRFHFRKRKTQSVIRCWHRNRHRTSRSIAYRPRTRGRRSTRR